jgi:hypothetical protein
VCDSPDQAANYYPHAGFEVFIPEVMKSSIVWDITPCSPLEISRHFGETSPPYSKSNKSSKIQARKQVANFNGKREGKRLFGRHSRRWEDNIEMNHKEKGCER